MRFILQILFILIIGYLLELLLPWWSIAITAFLGGILLRSKYSFFAGFLGAGLLWLLKAYLIDSEASSNLTEKVATIFTVSKLGLFVVTFLLAGFVGGFAALTGSLLRPKKKKNLYY